MMAMPQWRQKPGTGVEWINTPHFWQAALVVGPAFGGKHSLIELGYGQIALSLEELLEGHSRHINSKRFLKAKVEIQEVDSHNQF